MLGMAAAAACQAKTSQTTPATDPPPASTDLEPAATPPVAQAEPEPDPPAPHAVKHRRVIEPQTHAGLETFAETVEVDGSLIIQPLAGNGGRDVVVYVPETVRPDQPMRLVVHFHGTYSENIQPEDPNQKKRVWIGWNRLQQVIEAVAEISQDENVALVYPISAGKRLPPEHKGWSNKAYDTVWMRPDTQGDDFAALLRASREVLHDLGVSAELLEPKVTAEGHSAGGIALWNVALTGTDEVAEYLFLDAGFREWADGCFNEVQAKATGALVSQVITHEGMADPMAGRTPWCRVMPEKMAELEKHQEFCAKPNNAERTPRGLEKAHTCENLQRAKDDWPRFEEWCGHMENDAIDLPGAYVFRTSIVHGEQPRNFAGGLNLAPDRFDQLRD